ncbi:hypothetical protein ACFL2T_04025, partial [Elusimicrobiota bacterium]
GGIIGYEMLRRLQDRDIVVEAMVLLDSFWPSELGALEAEVFSSRPAGWLELYLLRVYGFSAFSPNEPAQGDDSVLAAAVAAGLVSPKICLKDLGELAGRQESIEGVFRQYQNGHPVIVPLVHVSASRPAELAPWRTRSAALWERRFNGPITTITTEGDHYGMIQPPLVESLAERLEKVLSDMKATETR